MKSLKMFAFVFAASACLVSCDQFVVEDGQEAAAALLRDPSSAQFRKVRTDGQGYVCGEINGKNGFGAYAGFSQFYAFKTGDGTWMAAINNEEELSKLPPELAQITRENLETAMARCDGDEEREKAILDRQTQRMCDEGSQDMCELIKAQKSVSQEDQ